MTETAASSLRSRIGAGLAWSTVNSLVLRLGSFAVGIVLARLLAPEQFGVFAVALTVQAVLMTLADLGMSTDLIRSANAEAKGPTVATLALVSGTVLTGAMAASAQGLADLLGSSQAGPVIAVMAFSLMLAGAGVVPYASLQRQFAQKKLFIIALVEFAVGTALTVGLVLGGWGVMGLAAARIASQLLTLVLQFILSGERVRFGFDPAFAPGILRYGIPVACANMLSWALLNVDNVAISRLAGPVALGFYFLAFNISNWPMSAIGQVVRSVSIPAFARLASGRSDQSFAAVVGPVWAVSLLAGLMLALLSAPVVELVYGEKWLSAAVILAWLGLFGSLRTLFDLSASYLLARGASKATLIVQLAWIAALVPAMFTGVGIAGTSGAAIAHLGTALLIVCPAYAFALRSSGANLMAIGARLWPPVAAAIPAAGAALGAMALQPTPVAALLAGGAAGTGVYALILATWFRRQVREAVRWMPGSEVRKNTESDANQGLAAPSGGMP
ncbi:MAG TPA: lipopolysaccharide biosynthesis protein [Arthrobacter sp.]|nr:lipopolysaccharide biosynthesis protein [Arthrobacter sp.]